MAIFSGDISSSEDILQQRSPPAIFAPATISSCDVCSSDDLPPPTSPPATISSGFFLVVLCVLSAKSSVSPFCSGSAGQLATSSHSRVHKSNEEVGPLSPLFVSITAGLSASVAAAASHAFDTTRTRSQCTVLPKVCFALCTGQ
ncbi:hypothetical protein Ahy_B07g086648 [Arachis hypogaea]|uniref:Uncharacterized protein n=1 Tax=Arachis hypogaea TaxID=3818 RepID=A0A444YA54_ARAHY|nr:hypothetical protein Ahy_B07g086648 [Arachis hypogaea]